MRFLRQLIASFSSYFKAISFISAHRMWAYLLVPAVLYAVLFLGLSVPVWKLAGWISQSVIDLTGVDTLEGFLGSSLTVVVTFISWVIGFLVYFKLYRYIVLLLSPPALAILAEKTMAMLSGNTQPFNISQVIQDALRGLVITIKNLLVELAITIPLYLLSLIPLLTPFVAILVILVESYFIGFSMLDYRNEYVRMSAKDSRQLIARNKGLAIGNGAAFSLLLAIPIVGVLFAPSLAVISACLASTEME